MNFRDLGIIIERRPLQEHTIITVFTKNYGLYSALIRRSKLNNNLCPGSLVDFFWQARLHEHLGAAKCELIKSHYSIMLDKTRLYAFNSVISIIKAAFGEREPHNNFFPLLLDFISNLSHNFCFTSYIKLELAVLAQNGYALQLDSCASTGIKDNLYYISPKSGKAISKAAGSCYHNKLLILPRFLLEGQGKLPSSEIDAAAKADAFKLTSYFLNRYIFHNSIAPPARTIFSEYILNNDQ